MANIEVKLRRGTTSQHTGFTGAEGEVTVDTDKDTVIVHDGSTAGGHELAKASDAYSHPNHTGDVTSTGDGATVIANDAVTPAKLDDTQVYEALGFRTNGESFIAQGTAAGGIGIRFDKTNNPSPTGQIDLFVDPNGALQITAPQNAVADRPLATLSNGSDLSVYGTVTGTNIVESSGSLNQEVRSSSSANLGYVIMYSGGEQLNQKLVHLVPVNGKFIINWVNDDATAGLAVQLDQATGNWEPLDNGSQDLGATSKRWDDVWSNGTFNGSDQNIKQDIEDLDEAEKRVATKCKGLIKKYRMKDAVAKKGDDARIHVGIIAQELQAAFESEGLDAFRYSMIGRDTWWEGTDSEGKRDVKDEATEGYTEVTQMSVRYNELLAFIIAAM